MFRGSVHIDIQDIVLIDEVDKTGSFSGAANRLHRTRSAITQHVQKLESHLGFRIFDRSSYRPHLTPEGKLFLERGRPLLRNFHRFSSEVQHIQQGWESEFSIAVDDVIGAESLFFLIEAFRKIAPQVTIRLHREVLNGCWDALLSHRADIAVGASGVPPIELLCKQVPLGSVEFVYAVTPSHPLAHLDRKVTSNDLEAYPMIVVPDTSQTLQKRTTGIASQQSKIIVPTMDDKVLAQTCGLGVGYLPVLRIQHLLNEGKLVALELTDHAKKVVDFSIAWLDDAENKSLSWFVQHLSQDHIKEEILKPRIH